MNVSFLCVCPVIDDEFRRLRIHSTVASWIHSYIDNVMTKFMINSWTDA